MSPSPVWHPFTQHSLLEPIPQIVGAKGAYLHGPEERRILDAISSWWVTTHGHCNPRITAAIRDAAEQLDQIIFAGFTHEPAEEVAAGLVELMPEHLTRVFFTDSGSTSVEVALKMALGFWKNRSEPRHRIIVMDHAYHGDTIGAMSVGARGVFNQAYEPLLFEVSRVPFPAAGKAQATLDALEHACRSGAAALIVEPLILGAGGMLTYSPETLREMRRICAHHEVLFIADEVMTGWGRTGTLLACDAAEISPDILCLSKGLTGGSLPLAVTVASEPIYAAHLSPDRARMFFHSSSFTANPIACAAAAANISIWREEPILERVAVIERLQGQHLAEIARLPGVRNPRQLGTITALELGAGEGAYLSDLGPRLLRFFLDRDLLIRPLGNTVYVMPPYCTGASDLDRAYDAIAEASELVVSRI